MNLFQNPLQPSTLSAGSIVYYADAHTLGNAYLHGLQVTKIMVSHEKAFVLDNGKRFNPETGVEITRGAQGLLYPYNSTTKAMVQDAEDKLFLVNEVLSINFNTLTTQQLSMIRDVARGAFTQVSSSPCSGGCGGCDDTVQVAGINIDISDILPVEVEPGLHGLAAFHGARQSETEVSATIGFNDASYELTEAELDDIEDADEEDELINTYHGDGG